MLIMKNGDSVEKVKESKRKRAARCCGQLIFLIYIGLLIYFLFFADRYGHTPGIRHEAAYNLIPGREIRRYITSVGKLGKRAVFVNLFGNVIGFIPFGFFMPVATRWMRSLSKTAAAACCLSVIVEIVQLLTASGSCDIDDVILNTLGAVIGYGLFLLTDDMRKAVQRKYPRI